LNPPCEQQPTPTAPVENNPGGFEDPEKGFKEPRGENSTNFTDTNRKNHRVPSNVDEPTSNDEGGLNTANRTPERRSETNTAEKKR
jgi:hypothetical protein